MFNDVSIRSTALSGVDLDGTLNVTANPVGAALFSHNAHGNKDDKLLVTIENAFFKNKFTTLRYNFHYVGRMEPDQADFSNLMLDFDAAYSLLLDKAVVSDVFLIGKSIGGVASIKYATDNRLKCPLVVLGFYQPGVAKYIQEADLRHLKAPILIIHGEKDQYTPPGSIRDYLGRLGISPKLVEISGAAHDLYSSDEGVRKSEDIEMEILTHIAQFVTQSTSTL